MLVVQCVECGRTVQLRLKSSSGGNGGLLRERSQNLREFISVLSSEKRIPGHGQSHSSSNCLLCVKVIKSSKWPECQGRVQGSQRALDHSTLQQLGHKALKADEHNHLLKFFCC